MRIALFTETFLPKIDGVVTILCLALRRFQERGHQALVFGPPDMPPEYAGARCIPTGGPRFPLYPELRINLPRLRILRELIAFRPDVVHVVNPAFLGPTGIAAARFLRLPLVASTHMDIPSYTRHYAGAWGESIAWAYFRGLHNAAHLNLAPSSASVQQVRANGYRRVRWWRRGVELERFRPDMGSQAMRMRLSDGNPEQLLAVYVGRLSREKGVDLLREPLAATPGVRLALIGGGPEAEQMRTHFAGTPTVLTGFLRGNELVEAYASADVLVFPSTSETFGMAPLEAMACGLPVIGTMTGGLVDTLRNGVNALTYDPAQPQAIAGHLQRLRDDPVLRAHLRAGALAHAQARPWQATMDQLIDLYRIAIRVQRMASAIRPDTTRSL